MRAGEEARCSCFSPAPLAAVVTVLLALTGCKIVYDEPPSKDGTSAPRAQAGFDAAAYVDGLWGSKVTPFLAEKAIDVASLLPALAEDPEEAGKKYGHRADAEGSPWSFAVKGRGRVVSTSTASRAGTMVLEVKAGGAPRQVTLQIGPVVRGSALRDCLPFFSFGDVKNQIEFAQIGRAMNDRAIQAVEEQVRALGAAGTEVAFTGATSLTGGETLLITPASLVPTSGSAR
jgi:predicted lipoprotein